MLCTIYYIAPHYLRKSRGALPPETPRNGEPKPLKGAPSDGKASHGLTLRVSCETFACTLGGTRTHVHFHPSPFVTDL